MSDLISTVDERHLRRCVELAKQALQNGDDPFGSVLVGADGAVLAEEMNREKSDRDPTAHPELALVRWAIEHLTPDQRATSTVYTSGEHCPMCAAARGWDASSLPHRRRSSPGGGSRGVCHLLQ